MASYDPDSGQVFREWTISRRTLAPSHDRDWSRAQPTSTKLARGAKGPRTLVDMATSIVALNVGSLADDHVDAMPPRTRLRVWQFLEARGTNLHAWKLFPKYLLHGEDDSEPTLSQYRYRQHICRPSYPLAVYTSPLASHLGDFITHLVISGGCEFSTNEMVTLADMPNLGALEIIQPADELQSAFPEVTDRLVRGWLDKPDPFPLLRILRIWGDQATTTKSLQDLAKLPSLVVYDVIGARDDWRHAARHARESGWEISESASKTEHILLPYLKLLDPEADVQRRWLSAHVVETDLTSVCNDSKCEVNFTPYGDAPELFKYLTEGGIERPRRKEAIHPYPGNCHGIAFEAWAFWLYAFIGQVTSDEDLGVDTQAVVGPFVLPSKPMACLFLGHSGRGGIAARPSYIRRGLFATLGCTFTRKTTPRKKASEKQRDPTQEKTQKPVNSRKRQRLDDMLGSFG